MQLSTVLFSAWSLLCLGLAVHHIRRGRVTCHQQWVKRLLATHWGIVTVRLVAPFSFTLSRLLGITLLESTETDSVQRAYGAWFWAGFVLAVGAAEALWV